MIDIREDGWRIKKEVSLGDVIAIVIAITAVLTGYMQLNTRIAVIETISNTNTAAISGTITEIKTELRRLNDKLERMIESPPVRK